MHTLKRNLAGLSVAVVMAAAFAAPVVAHEGEEHTATTENRTTTTAKLTAERVRGKLDDARKKVCEARKNNITKIVTDAGNAGQRQLNLFSNIATKVEQFYVDKKLSASGYTAAVANVNAKKTYAQTAINNVKAAAPTIDCSAGDPVATVDGFKAQITTMRQALKDLRTAVKDLIVTVKTSAGESH